MGWFRMANMGKEITGKLDAFFETGSEGVHWAIYDPSFDKYGYPEWGIFSGTEVWEPNDLNRHGVAIEVWHIDGRMIPDPIMKDPDYYLSSLWHGQSSGDREADNRLMERWEFSINYTEDNIGTPTTDRVPFGISRNQKVVAHIEWDDGHKECRKSDTLWVRKGSYDGLFFLDNGDHLEIYDDDDNLIWSGIINLRKIGLYEQSAHGLWLNKGAQIGFENDEWAKYFIKKYKAKLIKYSV